MKIALVAPTYLPARRANTIQVMKMAEAIAESGREIQVFVPQPDPLAPRPGWRELAHHYGLSFPFPVTWLPVAPAFRSYDFGWRSVRRASAWQRS